MNISVVIPVYKKKEMFLKNLAANMKFIKGLEIIVVDDGSKENIQADVEKLYPRVKVLTYAKNRGFSTAANSGAAACKGDLIMFVNSDVLLKNDSYKKAVKQFDDNKVFAVSFAQTEKDGRVVGKNKVYFKNGLVHHGPLDSRNKGLNGWAEGGACLIRRDYFGELDGFDTIYCPFYWEDVDLGYRACKRGLRIIFDPAISAEHHHESTIGSFYSKKFIRTTALRNQLIFFWKNIDDFSMWSQHIIFLIKSTFKAFFKLDFVWFRAVFQAKMKILKIVQYRLRKKKFSLNDKEIFQMVK